MQKTVLRWWFVAQLKLLMKSENEWPKKLPAIINFHCEHLSKAPQKRTKNSLQLDFHLAAFVWQQHLLLGIFLKILTSAFSHPRSETHILKWCWPADRQCCGSFGRLACPLRISTDDACWETSVWSSCTQWTSRFWFDDSVDARCESVSRQQISQHPNDHIVWRNSRYSRQDGGRTTLHLWTWWTTTINAKRKPFSANVRDNEGDKRNHRTVEHCPDLQMPCPKAMWGAMGILAGQGDYSN